MSDPYRHPTRPARVPDVELPEDPVPDDPVLDRLRREVDRLHHEIQRDRHASAITQRIAAAVVAVGLLLMLAAHVWFAS